MRAFRRSGSARPASALRRCFICADRDLPLSFAARLRQELDRGAMGALYLAKHPHLSVAFETKQLGVLRAIARACDAVFRLSERARR